MYQPDEIKAITRKMHKYFDNPIALVAQESGKSTGEEPPPRGGFMEPSGSSERPFIPEAPLRCGYLSDGRNRSCFSTRSSGRAQTGAGFGLNLG